MKIIMPYIDSNEISDLKAKLSRPEIIFERPTVNSGMTTNQERTVVAKLRVPPKK